MRRTTQAIAAIMLMFATVLVMGCTEKDTPGTEFTDDWVDLGLPSGLLWATRNVGASSPTDYGNYYAWGETAKKEIYDWSTYRYCTVDEEGELQTLTKYNTRSQYGTVDSLTTLEAMDDAATAVLGNGARIPTKEEWQELMDNTSSEWTTLNGVNGRMFTATNGNSLFLPASGRRHDSERYYAGEYGIYWSASLREDNPSVAWRFIFHSDDQSMSNCRRCNGPATRPVRSTTKVATVSTGLRRSTRAPRTARGAATFITAT